jgi:hypothetical protein
MGLAVPAIADDLPKSGSFDLQTGLKFIGDATQLAEKHTLTAGKVWGVGFNAAGKGPLHMAPTVCTIETEAIEGTGTGPRQVCLERCRRRPNVCRVVQQIFADEPQRRRGHDNLGDGQVRRNPGQGSLPLDEGQCQWPAGLHAALRLPTDARSRGPKRAFFDHIEWQVAFH